VIKHGAIGGRKLLDQASDFLTEYSLDDFETANADKQFQSRLSGLIAAQVAFKASIVANDESESANRTDAKSRKILNFGHTLAHALEKVTNYKYLRHGEAVGYGILFAAELSKKLALCDEKDVKLLNDVVRRVGPLPSLAGIDPKEVFEAFKFDKKHLAGSLQMVLLRGIGKPVIVTERDIPQSSIKTVLSKLLRKWA
jgi:3-dehydroquinate synthase